VRQQRGVRSGAQIRAPHHARILQVYVWFLMGPVPVPFEDFDVQYTVRIRGRFDPSRPIR
jgi:hypothetical protein